MSHRVHHTKDNVSLPPISQIFNIPPGQSQHSTSQIQSTQPNANAPYGYAGYIPQQDQQHIRRHSYAPLQQNEHSQPYMGINSGSSAFYDPGLNPNRSASHSVPCYGTSYAYPNRDETPNPTYYNPNSYVPQSSDFPNFNQPPFNPSRATPPFNGVNPNTRQYSGMPAYPSGGYPARVNEQSYALRPEMSGHAFGEGMAVPSGNDGSREPEPYDVSSKTRYECTYCGKGFSRPSALKIHVISHTGDKDFVCPEETCRRKFGIRSNMLRHIRLVHQNMPTPSEHSYDGTE